MVFSLVSCLAALAAISVTYAAEGDMCNMDNPCSVGCCMPSRHSIGGMGGMMGNMGMGGMMGGMMDQIPPFMKDMMDQIPFMKDMMGMMMRAEARGFMDMIMPGGGRPGRRPPPPRQMNGTCVVFKEGDRCMPCPEMSTTPYPTTVSASTDGSVSDTTTMDNTIMSGPGRRPRLPCCSCGGDLTCNAMTMKCEKRSTTDPSTTSTAGA